MTLFYNVTTNLLPPPPPVMHDNITIRFAKWANCVEMCVTQYTEYRHANI